MQEQDTRYAPPTAHVQDVQPEAGSGQLAERTTRLWAALVDTGISVGVMALVGVMSSLDVWGQNSQGNWQELVVRGLLGFALFMALHGWLLARRGQTIGKALFKLRMVRPDGSPASFARLAGLRYGVLTLLSSIPVIGPFIALIDALFIFGASRRCLHDRIADTVVQRA